MCSSCPEGEEELGSEQEEAARVSRLKDFQGERQTQDPSTHPPPPHRGGETPFDFWVEGFAAIFSGSDFSNKKGG